MCKDSNDTVAREPYLSTLHAAGGARVAAGDVAVPVPVPILVARQETFILHEVDLFVRPCRRSSNEWAGENSKKKHHLDPVVGGTASWES